MFSIAKLLQNTKVLMNPSFAASFQSANFATSKSIEEKLGLPLRPKKPLTPFFRYLTNARAQVREQNPKISAIDIVREISKKWTSVDDALKKKLTDEYLKDRTEYTKQLAAYESKLTDTQKHDIQIAKEDRAVDKEKRAFRKKVREHNRPKRPASGYLRFLAEHHSTRGKMDKDEFMRKVAAAWHELPEAKRAAYNDAAKAESVKYKAELAKWEKEMVRLGNVDLVRKEALIEVDQSKPKRAMRAKAAKSD